MYELGSWVKACTSIIARDSLGKIFHGRNLDYSFRDEITGLVATVHFHKGGKHIYTMTQLVGMIGSPTGIKPDGYTISINERMT
jgi:hypothetical protein